MIGRVLGASRRGESFARIAIVISVIAALFVIAPPANAAPPHVGFATTGAAVAESGTVDVTIVLDTGSAPGVAPLASAIAFDVVDASTGSASGSGGSPDYSFSTTPLQFDIGDDTGATRTAQVSIVSDTRDEDNETVDLELQEVTTGGVDATKAAHTLTINDNDSPPTVSIAGAGSVAEGATASFAVSLSAESGKTVTVDWATVNGSAAAPGDFDADSGTVTFSPGDTSDTVTVDTNTDGLIEPNQSFTVELTSPVNATPGNMSGSATITDGTTVPTVSIGNAGTVTEGGTASFEVTLSSSLGETATVAYSTANGTAVAGQDYTAKSGTVTFVAGDTSETVTVSTTNDTLDEPTEAFTVSLSSPVNATPGDMSGSATISDNDAPPTVMIEDSGLTESAGTMDFNVRLSTASGRTVTVAYATSNGTAIAPGDYAATSGTVTFTPGDTLETVSVTIANDARNEASEAFSVTLSSPTFATITGGPATGTIADDDPVPTLSVSSEQVEEGTVATFDIDLSAASGRTVTVRYITANGTAVAPGDYTARPSTLVTFAVGETNKTFTVSTAEDALDEANETFTVVLSSPTNATIAGGTGTGEILDDDGAPGLSALDPTAAATEGAAGTLGRLEFTVSLLPASGQTVTVAYTTANGTATSASDYSTRTGVLTFDPGETTETVTVPVTNDAVDEIAETVLLNISGAVNSVIVPGAAQATGTILDNDNVAPTPSIRITDQAGAPGVEFDTGETVRLRVDFTDPGLADSHTATLDWGDGTLAEMFPVTPAGGRSFERMHTYAAEGFQTISLVVADADGGSGSKTGFVKIVAGTGSGGGAHRTGLVDPGSGKWYLYNASGALTTSFFYGNPGDYPFMGDWNCDGVETPGLYRQSDGFVYLRDLNTQGIADIRFFFGNPGDVPIAGDFNGDGCDTVSIYRPSNQTFYIINKLGANDGGLGAAETSYVFGNPGDKPFVGDFNSNGIETVGLHRESTGLVYFRNTHTQGNADNQFIFGDPSDRLIAGDWTGNGEFTPALFRPSNTTTYFRFTNTQGNADDQFVASPVSPGWLPVSGITGF